VKYIELKVNLLKTLTDGLFELLDSLNVEGYYEILFDSSVPKKSEQIIRDDTHIYVYLNEEDLKSELSILIFLKSSSADKYFLERRSIETQDYEASYKEFYKPFLIGEKLLLIPSWEKNSDYLKNNSIEKDIKPLYLNPGLAFGTGHHETTKLMIRRLEVIIKKGESVLDVGTGSGILSIAAGLCGASKILAIDIDPNSVRSAETNWKENEIISSIDFTVKEGGFDHPEIANRNFSLALANITFAVISGNIAEISKIKTPHFLFSGIIFEKKGSAIELFKRNLGGNMVYLEELNEWLLIEWVR